MSERRRRIKLLAYLEAVSWSMLACHGMCNVRSGNASSTSLHASESPEGLSGTFWRDLQGDLERVRSLVLAMRRRVQAAQAEWGLEAHAIAAQADRLVDGRYAASNAAPDEVGPSAAASAASSHDNDSMLAPAIAFAIAAKLHQLFCR